MIDKQILNYKIIREIGSGGMATVYEASHVKLKTKVAIKVLNPVLAANEGIRKRFEQEAIIMASLDHNGITKVIDFDEEEGRLAIIMEFLHGQTLNEYIDQVGALGAKGSKDLFKSILEAFKYAHNKGIVHRDVKPSNIFITVEGNVKIMDFGIAKIVEDGASVLTQTGTQMGTPVFMSPEQVNDSKNIDHRTDIYSLGVMLWYMKQGHPPYDGDKLSSFQIFKQIDSEPLPEIEAHSEMNEVIQKATAKNVEDRYNDCEMFSNALDLNKTEQKPILPEQTIISEPKKIEEPVNLRNIPEENEKSISDKSSGQAIQSSTKQNIEQEVTGNINRYLNLSLWSVVIACLVYGISRLIYFIMFLEDSI